MLEWVLWYWIACAITLWIILGMSTEKYKQKKGDPPFLAIEIFGGIIAGIIIPIIICNEIGTYIAKKTKKNRRGREAE